MRPLLLLLAVTLALAVTACDSGTQNAAQDCPAGSGAVFVQNGPNGAGCYCPAGTVPDVSGAHCVTGDPCGPWKRTVDGACVDIDECAEHTYCDPNAVCQNVTGDAPRCACDLESIGDGVTCTACGEGMIANEDGTACVPGSICGDFARDDGQGHCVDIDECAEHTYCDAHAACTNVTNAAPRCACTGPYAGDGRTCTPCDADEWGSQDGTTCVPYDGSEPCTHGGVCSSLADPNGPYPDMQCAGSVGPEQIWFQTHQKTTFKVDCRCPHGGIDGEQFCIAPTGNEGHHEDLGLGAGVSAADSPSGEIKGCATDFGAKLVYYGVNWADGGDSRRGFVFAMDPATANRTLVSGEYSDPVSGLYEKGAGEHFDTILDLALGKDGHLYVFEDSVPGSTSDDTSPLFGRSVYRVDLATGDRELWWNDRDARFDAAQCGGPDGDPNVRPDIFNHQFELDENDNILFTDRSGDIIRVANDRTSCEYVTSSSDSGPGTGFDISFDSGWAYDAAAKAIYATSFFGGLYKVDVATGNRTRLWGGPVGTGPGPGMWQFMYIPYLKLWVAGGNEAQTPSNATIFDPASGDTWQWMYQRPDAETGGGTGGQNTFVGPINTNPTGYLRGPITGVLDSTLIDRPWCLSPLAEDRIFVATDRVGIVIVEMQTGNTMNFSQ